MQNIVVVQGADMDKRGIEQIEIFGPETLQEINARIEEDAARLGLSVEIFHSNSAGEVTAYLADLDQELLIAGIINPAGFTVMDTRIPDVIAAMSLPFYEVHGSNPASRGIVSNVLPNCRGCVWGFGYAGYGVAMRAIVEDQKLRADISGKV
ncbi:MAG: type II 3-dehydroquinate dehydratase [Pseudomonadota bacterium]